MRYANNTVLLAENAKDLRQVFDTVVIKRAQTFL